MEAWRGIYQGEPGVVGIGEGSKYEQEQYVCGTLSGRVCAWSHAVADGRRISSSSEQGKAMQLGRERKGTSDNYYDMTVRVRALASCLLRWDSHGLLLFRSRFLPAVVCTEFKARVVVPHGAL